VDGFGNAFIAGATSSSDFPASAGALQSTKAALSDGFVTKLNASGTGILFSTFVGGSGDDSANAIAIDAGGNVYLCGTTASNNFPTANPRQAANGGGTSDVFVTKINSAGNALAYSTYLGGTGADFCAGIAVDASGNAYAVGRTASANFPTQSPLYSSGGVFVSALNTAGNGLIYSTYLAGNATDSASGVTVGGTGNVYVTGYTSSASFPTVNALQPAFTGGTHSNAFITVLGTVTSLAITKSHSGNFARGQNGATYAVTVTNGAAAGTTSGSVTVTETIPTGLTLVSMAGNGWTCAAGGNTCSRTDALVPGASYPAITVTVNVASNAPAQAVNHVVVSGGGSPAAAADDVTTITPAPVLSLSKSHAGNFVRGQNGATYTLVVSNAAGTGATSGTVVVTENLPSGLTFAGMTGTGWSCAGGVCSRSDVLAPGSSYPVITLSVNVSPTAPPQVTNQATVSGGGSSLANASDVTLIGGATTARIAKAGIFRSGLWIIDLNGDYQWSGAPLDRLISLGQANDFQLVGDWNGDGSAKAGIFRAGLWILDYNGNGQWDGPPADRFFYLGQAGDIPVVGDWNGDGRTKAGIYRNGQWILDYNGNGQWDGPAIDRIINLGQNGDVAVVGDWNGDGRAKAGIFRAGLWVLDYNGNGTWDGPAGGDRFFYLGQGGDTPVLGDWNGDGRTKAGIFRAGLWVLDINGNGQWDGPPADSFFYLGQAGDTPVVGDWNGDGRTKTGIFRAGLWVIDKNGNGQWDGPPTDVFFYLGQAGDVPIAAKW
jgi:uncharacterized repeat protein (TIGR01451 family)